MIMYPQLEQIVITHETIAHNLLELFLLLNFEEKKNPWER